MPDRPEEANTFSVYRDGDEIVVRLSLGEDGISCTTFHFTIEEALRVSSEMLRRASNG